VTDHTARGRLVILLIAGIPVTMFLAATWLWYYVARGDLDLVGSLGTHNSGTLVEPPRQIDEARLLDESGKELSFAALEPRWTLLVPAAGGVCGESCEQSLYLTRQIHVAMGKDRLQLQRIFVGQAPAAATPLDLVALRDNRPPPVSLADFLQSDHTGMLPVTLAGQAFARLFAEYQQDPTTWYLVDPRGWIMMSYNAGVSYKGVISDLKFLLNN